LPERLQLSRSKCAVMNFPNNMLCLQGFHCFIICLFRHCSILCFDCIFLRFLRHYTLSSRFPLFHYVLVTSLFVCSLRLSLPLFVMRYHLFRLFLRHFTIFSRFPLFYYLLITSLLFLGLDWLFLCLLGHNAIFSRFPWFHYVFVTSLLCSRLRLSIPLFITSPCFLLKVSIVSLSVCYVTSSSSSSSFFATNWNHIWNNIGPTRASKSHGMETMGGPYGIEIPLTRAT